MMTEANRTPPGRVPKDLDDAEKAEFLRLRRSGVGVNAALLKLTIGSGRYRRTLRSDPEFRRDAEAAADYLIESLVMLRYQAAVKDNDAGAQEFLINRHDRARQFAATLRLKRSEIKAKNGDGGGDLGRRIDIPGLAGPRRRQAEGGHGDGDAPEGPLGLRPGGDG